MIANGKRITTKGGERETRRGTEAQTQKLIPAWMSPLVVRTAGKPSSSSGGGGVI